MTPRTIFVNTSGWLALYDANDPHHQLARELWEDLRNQPVRLVTTDYVLDETFTALKMLGSPEAAQAFHQLITNSSILRLFMVDSVIFDRGWRLFAQNQQPGWTFTDCVNYAVIQYLGISEVLTFDPEFTMPGLVTIPSGAS
jgi:predicted nucleic acid-binding protein